MDSDFNNRKQVENKNIAVKQFFITSTVSMTCMVFGLGLGGPTVFIPQIRKETNSTVTITDEMVSWISSAISFGGIVWVIILSIMAHYIGRKHTITFINISALIAFLNLYFCTNATQILISQLILGTTASTVKTTGIMVFTEYSSPQYRGIFMTIATGCVFWGVWIANALGTFFYWKTIPLFGIICTIYVFVIQFTIGMESPYWLASKGKYKMCEISHRKIKGTSEESEIELRTLIRNQRALTEDSKFEVKSDNIVYKHFKIILQPEIYKPMFYCFLISCLYNWTGKLVLTVYSLEVIKKITYSERTAYIGMLILDGISILTIYVTCVSVKYFKRRSLLILSSLITIFFLLSIALYMILIKCSLLSENNYVFLFMLMCYSLAVCSGPVVMIGVLHGELVPMSHRTFSFILIALEAKTSAAIFLKIAPYLFKQLGIHGTFITLSVGSMIFLFIIYKYLPETKDKTLDEISEYFKPRMVEECIESQRIFNDDNIDKEN